MVRYFIHMAFDGTRYHGWQVQPNAISVQGTLEHVFSTMTGQPVRVTGAGRTDTGVHASSYYAHVDLPEEIKIPDSQFVFRLNRFLPEDILILSIDRVKGEAHARFSAIYRTYQYRISKQKPLFDRAYVHVYHGQLNTGEINRCCDILKDYNDFTSFSKLHTDVKTNNCSVRHAEWKNSSFGYIFEIQADRFLRNMVRSLAGTLLEVGIGRMDLAGFRKIIEARNRNLAGPSLPARGLFLVDIGYPEGIYI